MFAFFNNTYIPNYQKSLLDGEREVGFILSGENYEDLAWDFVEQFLDNPETQNLMRGTNIGNVSIEGFEPHPSFKKTSRYHTARFTQDWWERHEWMLSDFLGGSFSNGIRMSEFRHYFNEDALLRMYLVFIVGRYYSEFHGIPDEPIDAAVVMNWFNKIGYLRWIDSDDPLMKECLDRARD